MKKRSWSFPAGPLLDLRAEVACRAEIRKELIEWVAPNVGSQGRSRGGWRRSSAPAPACPVTHRCQSTIPTSNSTAAFFTLNQAVLDPAASVVKQVPGQIRDRFEDLDANLKEPRIFANDILQGRFNAAGITLGRIIFNSTFGLGGLFDVAAQGGLPQQSGDFGQTMFVWGVPAGTYVDDPLLRSLDPARFGRRGG